MSKGKKRAWSVFEIIEGHIAAIEEDHSKWQCGITADPESTRLEMKQFGSDWISDHAGTALDARHIEVLLRQNGCHGVPHLGGEGAHYIFACLLPAETLR